MGKWMLGTLQPHATEIRIFHSKCCQAILGITMWEVSMYKVTNSNVLARLHMPKIEHVIHWRRLDWMVKIASMASSRNQHTFINAWMTSPRTIGRPNLITRESFMKSLKYCHNYGGTDFKNLKCPNGKLKQWLSMARLSNTSWLDNIEFLRKPRFSNAVDFYKTYLN